MSLLCIRTSWKTTIKMLLAMATSLLIIVVYMVYSFNLLNDYTSSGIIRINTSTNLTKHILYWNPFTSHLKYSIGFGYETFKDCKYKNCYATDNKTMIPLEEFDLIIFHMPNYNKNTYGVPWIRSPHQIYMYMNVEPPIKVVLNLKQYQDYFNWTMTYRYDSDVVKRYGLVTKMKTNNVNGMPSREFLRNKSKLAAWFVSNCNTGSKREILIKEIQKYMPVDVYGVCGPLNCKKQSLKISAPECYNMIEKNYKFYFSFENSFCKDYSTEKLYKVLKKNIIPVVYGGDDYKISAPPNSVINVADFKNVQELVKYLKYLDTNEEEYLKYFEWKKNYYISTPSKACEICKKLHKPMERSVYKDIEKWWIGEDSSICKIGKQLPEIVRDLLPENFSVETSSSENQNKLFDSIVKWFV